MTRALPVVVSLLACLLVPASAAAVAPPTDRYIVVLKDSADSAAVAKEHGNRYGVQDRVVYGTAIEGYAGKVPPGQLAKIQSDPRVQYVEPDGVAYALDTQSGATWGLDRIDQSALPLSGTYTYSQTGFGVTAYVIDTGIRTDHTEFGGRASRSSSADFVSPSTDGNDCDGHGTHVAGTIGGTTYGVAKGVSLKAVRVLDCGGSGYWSWVIAGIDWVTTNHAEGTPAVANMSLGGGASSAVDDAVEESIADGVTYSVAAGNSGRDACRYSPARAQNALTIGATSNTDTRASWSNWGNCVDWFAPGVSITSAYISSTTATATWSGTSMAAPHVAGAAALYLQTDTDASPTDVRTALWNALTTGIVINSKSINNHLLFVHNFGSVPPVVPDTTPPAVPSGLVATAGDAQVSLGWADNTDSDLEGYYVYRSDDGGDYVPLNGSPVASSELVDASVTNGTPYSYYVTAVDTTGNESDASNVASATPQAASVTPPAFALSASGYKVKGEKNVDLAWNGATSNVDVFRNGTLVTTTTNDGEHHETLGKGGGSYTYKLCEAGTSTCSNESTVVF